MMGQEGGAMQAEMQRILLALKKMGAVTLPVKSPMGGENPEQAVHEFIAKYATKLQPSSVEPGGIASTFVGRIGQDPMKSRQIAMSMGEPAVDRLAEGGKPTLPGGQENYSGLPSQILSLLRFLIQGKGMPK